MTFPIDCLHHPSFHHHLSRKKMYLNGGLTKIHLKCWMMNKRCYCITNHYTDRDRLFLVISTFLSYHGEQCCKSIIQIVPYHKDPNANSDAIYYYATSDEAPSLNSSYHKIKGIWLGIENFVLRKMENRFMMEKFIHTKYRPKICFTV